MTIIVNVLCNNCVQSDMLDNLTASNVMYVCERFAREHYIMPEEIFIITYGKLIEINLKSALQSVIQSELDKQLQEKTTW